MGRPRRQISSGASARLGRSSRRPRARHPPATTAHDGHRGRAVRRGGRRHARARAPDDRHRPRERICRRRARPRGRGSGCRLACLPLIACARVTKSENLHTACPLQILSAPCSACSLIVGDDPGVRSTMSSSTECRLHDGEHDDRAQQHRGQHRRGGRRGVNSCQWSHSIIQTADGMPFPGASGRVELPTFLG